MKKISFKFLTALIAVVVAIMSLPMNIFAEELQNSINQTDIENEALDTETSENNIGETQKQIVEVTDLRTENSKTFRLPDGSYYLAQYSADIHSLDENGEWQNIDNTLSESGSEISTKNAKIKFAKKTNGSEKLFTLHDGNKKLTLSLNGAEKGVLGQIKNNDDVLPEEATELQKMTTLSKISASIIYENILPDTDLEYVINGSNIKENIIVKAPSDNYSYSFTMALNNLTAILNSEGEIIISDSTTGETVYTIPAPVMWDASGEASNNAVFALEACDDGKYTLTVTADSAWMNAAEREFPVTIDPPIYAGSTGVTDMTVNGNVKLNQTVLYVSPNNRSYWKMNSLPDLPSSAYIVKAEIIAKTYPNSDVVDGYVGVYEVINSWSESGNVMSSDEGTLITNYIDIQRVTQNEGVLYGGNIYSWNVTPLVKKWYSNSTTNYGIALAAVSENSFVGAAVFCSSEYSATTSNRPQLAITYRDMKGIEDYWSYTSQSAGFAGSGSINNATGNLVFAIPTLTSLDALMPFTPTLVYNSSMAGVKYEYDNAQTSYGGTHTARGFKWNLSETLIKKAYTDAYGTDKYMYVWSDGDGTEHYFMPEANTTQAITIYTDEDGLQLELTEDPSQNVITVKDSANNVRTFENISTPIDGVESRWYLKSITDESGNKLSFEFDSGLKPISVIMTPKDGGGITQLCIEYKNYRPYVVYNPHTHEAVIFRYSSTTSGAISIGATEYLRQIIRVHSTNDAEWQTFYNSNANANLGNVTVDAVAEYSYDTSGRITSVTNNLSKYKLVYQYDGAGRVVSVTEQAIGTTTVTGQRVNLTYGASNTVIRTSGSDDIINNSDDLLTTYCYDGEGRTVSCYTTDLERTQIYGASSGQYEDTNEKAKNSLKSSVQTSAQATNYLINGGFESTEESASGIPYWMKYGSAVLDSGSAYDGNNEVKLSVSSTSNTARIKQSLFLPDGEYTLSLRVASIDAADGVTLIIRAVPADYGSNTYTKELPLNEFSASGDYTFDSLTFTVDSGISEEFGIWVELTGNTSAEVYVDNVMLSRTIGAAEYDMMHAGSFDLDGFEGRRTTDFWEVWSQATNTVTEISYTDIVSSGTDAFGKVITVAPVIGNAKIYTQNVYTAPQSHINDYIAGEFSNDPETHYTLSGWGKGTAQSYGDGAIFAMYAVVKYYHKDNGESTEEYCVDFNKDITDWQFASLGFSIDPSRGVVKSIDIELMYTHHPGIGYFDNISLVKNSTSTAVYKYNSAGDVKSVQNGENKAWYAYDENGNIARAVSSNGYIVEYIYDELNRMICSVNKYYEGHITSDLYENIDVGEELYVSDFNIYNYNNYGQAVGVNVGTVDDSLGVPVDAEGNIDYTNYLISLESNARKISGGSVSYNTQAGSPIFGTVSTETDALGNVTRYFYDQNTGRLLAAFAPENEASEYAYGTSYTYDAIGNVIGVRPAIYEMAVGLYWTDTSSASVNYTYDSSIRLSTVSTKTSTYSYVYDAFGNKTVVKVGNKTLASYSYNANNGKLNTLSYGNGLSVKYVYDTLDRISEIQYNIGTDGAFETVYEYEYDSAGNLYSVTDSITDSVTTYRYDLSGNVIHSYVYDSDSMRNESSTKLWYDSESRLSRVDYSYGYTYSGTVHTGTNTYTYNYSSQNGDLTSMLFDDDQMSGVIYPERDRFGRLTEKTVIFSYDIERLYQTQTYDYKTNGNKESALVSQMTSSVKTGANGTTLSSTSYSYEYDNSGNITQISRNGVVYNKYYYDTLDQLVREDNRDKNKTYVYEYDDAGNITSKKTYAFTTGTLGTATSTVNYTYGNANWGDLLTKYGSTTITYDAIGNPTKIGGYDLTWQGRELQSWSDDECTTIYYGYNADGIRTYKEILDDDIGYGTRHEYILSGSQIIGETVYDVTPASKTESCTVIYIYDESGSVIGMKYRTPSYSVGTFDYYFFEKNLQGDIIAVYSGASTKLCTFNYDAWGNSTISYESGVASSTKWFLSDYCVFRYRGYYYDSETGYYYLQSRYYNPTWGRFINADSYINANGDLIGFNMFAYCNNNPVMYVDPVGTQSISVKYSLSHYHLCLGTEAGGLGGGFAYGYTAFKFAEYTATITGLTFMPFVLIADSISSLFESDKAEEAEKVQTAPPQENKKVYFGAEKVNGSPWVIITRGMEIHDAVLWVEINKFKYGKDAVWGIYTKEKEDAYILAKLLSKGKEPIEDTKKPGVFAHYHVYGHNLAKKNDHFHVWYGEMGG